MEKSVNALKRSGKIHKVKYMLVTNPNNPTGTVLRKQTLKEIVDIANDNGIVLISDEIYDEIVYNRARFTSIGELAQGTPHIILNGASKCFDATGFRVGLMIVPENDKISDEMKRKLSDFAKLRLCVNTPAQYAFAEAIMNRKEHKRAISHMVSEIEERVNFAMHILKENQYIRTVEPNGAFYIFPRLDVDSLRTKNDRDFVDKLLKEELVQLARGSAFGSPNHFRIVALPPKEILEYAINRVNDFCNRIAK